jgi:hypothetical protein
MRRNIFLTVLIILTFVFLGAAAFTLYGPQLFDQGENSFVELPLGDAPQALRFTVLETGVHAISAADLRETNLPFVDFNVDELRLMRDGEEVPIYLAGDGDEATLYFYGVAVTDTLAAPAVYWLSPDPGTAMRQRDAAPLSTDIENKGWQRRVWEENTTFLAQAQGDDNWLGALLFAPADLDIELDNILTEGDSGELAIHVWSNNESATNPDHHIEVWLNDTKLKDHYWDGIKQQTIEMSLPDGVLLPGMNKLTLHAPGDTGAAGEAIYLDWASLDYFGPLDTSLGQLHFRSDARTIQVDVDSEEVLLFDVSTAHAPIVIQGYEVDDGILSFAGNDDERMHGYLVVQKDQLLTPHTSLSPEWETLKRDNLGADYLAIVAPVEGFAETIQPLLNHRQTQGLEVMTISADQIFDEFGFGRQTPQAIRDFLAYAVANWEPAPKFVLLVGDATYDIYDFTSGRNKNLLPTYLVYTEFAGYVASDTWFTIFDQESPAPSLRLGRFPAQTVEQLEAMVEKTVAYETNQADTSWSNRALLVADDEPRFDVASDHLNENLENTGYQTQKLYMTQNEDIHDAIISAVNHGVGILNYVGHGGVEVWGDELVLQSEDAAILENEGRLPIFTTFTCLNGYFNHPTSDALAETLLWAENGGVVAAIAPSGRSFTSQQTPLADAFYRFLLTGEAQTLGEALQRAKVETAVDPDLKEVIHTFNLLGDPALRFNLPQSSAATSGN